MYLIQVTLKLILISFCVEKAFSAPLPKSGDNEINIENFSYQLSLMKQNKHVCGAIIINKYWALSTADCVNGATSNDITLRAGSSSHKTGGTIHTPVEIIMHPNYSKQNKDYNIALIKVKTKFNSIKAKPITMLSRGSIIRPGTEAIVTGWGLLSPEGTDIPEKLQKIILPTRDQDECNNANRSLLTDRMFCAGYVTGGRDICTGYKGGPLVYNNRLIGIASLIKSCGETQGFSIFISIPKLRGWIKEKSGV